jgi:hypothetical protein
MTFDLKLALVCAQASDAAYKEDAPTRAALLAVAGLTEQRYITGIQSARALACTHPLYGLILAFQGTQFTQGEIDSIMANLKTDPVDIGNGRRVMQGYWEQWQSLKPLVSDLKPKVISGHSMGGSIAHLSVDTFSPDELVTFGAPKTANEAYWHSSRLLPLRFVRLEDFAPNWPFLHYDQPYNQFLWMHDGAVEDVMTRPPYPFNVSVPDHASEKYVADLVALNTLTPLSGAVA